MAAFCGMRIPSISEDSNDTELQFSPTNSLGQQSSIGSLPWAEDAILENKEEWEKIERIFYGEEDLPIDKQTREEFLEWMTAFPHLRVNGTSMNVYYDDLVKPSDENYDEIFAIDPPHLANPLGIECKKLSLNERRHQLKIDDAKASNILDFREGASDFNKYLRIASGPTVGRSVSNQDKVKDLFRNNNQNLTYIAQTQQQPYFQPNYIEKIKTYEYHPPIQPRIYEKSNKNIYSARLAPLELNITKIPFSLISSASSTTRMTPVMSLQFITADSQETGESSGFQTSKMPSTATRKVIKLPTLNRSQKFQNEIVGRSISAVSRSDGRMVMRRQFVKMNEVETNLKPKI